MARTSIDTTNRSNVQHIESRTMGWRMTALFLIAETTSLGVLALPSAVKDLGTGPGMSLLNFFYLLLWYTGYVVYKFTMRHPRIRSFADGVEQIFGRWGGWVCSLMQVLYLLFVMAAHIDGFSSMMSHVVDDGACKLYYKAVAVGLYLAMTVRRAIKSNDVTYIISCISIFVAAIIAMVGVSIASKDGVNSYALTPAYLTSFPRGAESVSTIIVASMAQIAYPTIISEMREPRDFPKALAVQQIVTLLFANVVAVLFYLEAGQAVLSPALGSAYGVIGKVAYGFASPSIIVAGVIAALIAAKGVYSQVWNIWAPLEEVTQEKSLRARVSWFLVISILNGSAFVLAWGIPIFEHLFSLMGALFGTMFALVFPAVFWFHDHWQGEDAAEQLPVATLQRPTDIESGEDSPSKDIPTVHMETLSTSRSTSQASSSASLPSNLNQQNQRPARSFARAFLNTVKKYPFFATLSMIILLMGIIILVIGTYSSIVGIINSSADRTSPSC